MTVFSVFKVLVIVMCVKTGLQLLLLRVLKQNGLFCVEVKCERNHSLSNFVQNCDFTLLEKSRILKGNPNEYLKIFNLCKTILRWSRSNEQKLMA